MRRDPESFVERIACRSFLFSWRQVGATGSRRHKGTGTQEANGSRLAVSNRTLSRFFFYVFCIFIPIDSLWFSSPCFRQYVTGNRTRNKIETFNISPFIFILILSLFIIPSHLIRNRNIRVSLTVFEIPPLPMCTYREDIAQRRLINTLSRY